MEDPITRSLINHKIPGSLMFMAKDGGRIVKGKKTGARKVGAAKRGFR